MRQSALIAEYLGAPTRELCFDLPLSTLFYDVRVYVVRTVAGGTTGFFIGIACASGGGARYTRR